MNGLRMANMVILAGAFLFVTLVVLFALEPDSTGRATTATTVNISSSTSANCSVSIVPGVNTISFPCISTAVDRSGVIDDTHIIAIYQYLPGQQDTWRVHNPGLPNYTVSDLTHLSRRAGYLVMANGPDTFQIQGLNVTSTNVPVVEGWNLVGYPSLTTKNADMSFQGINDTLRMAMTYDSGMYIRYPGGLLTETIPGSGYWMNVSQSGTWVVTQ